MGGGGGEAVLNSLSARDALSPRTHSSLLLQSGYLLDPHGRPSASLHTNSPLPQPWTWAKNRVGLNQTQGAELMGWLYERLGEYLSYQAGTAIEPKERVVALNWLYNRGFITECSCNIYFNYFAWLFNVNGLEWVYCCYYLFLKKHNHNGNLTS